MSLTERTVSVLLLAAAAVAAAAAAVLFRYVDPNAPGNPLPGCLFYQVTHFYCIGCGLTRALYALSHGDVLRALHMNPLGVGMLGVGPLMLLHTAGWRPAALGPIMSVLLSPRFWCILLPVYWVARNLPWWPFTLLAPA